MPKPRRFIPIRVFDSLYIPIIDRQDSMYEEIKTTFTYKNLTYYRKKQMGFFVDNLSPFDVSWSYKKDPTTDEDVIVVPRGGIKRVVKILEKYKFLPSWIDERITTEPVLGYENDVVLWDEQKPLVEAMLKHETCLIRSPTASGKTEAALKLIEHLLPLVGRVLVVIWEGTKKSGLLEQWIDRTSKRFGIAKDDVGIISGQKKKVCDITIGMQQTLKNHIDEYRYQFGAVICDEVQRFAANTFHEFVRKMPAKYRIGISADETRKDKREHLIYDAFGEVVEEIDKEILLGRNLICPVVVRIIPTEYKYFLRVDDKYVPWNELDSAMKDFNIFLRDLYHDDNRESLIASFLIPCLRAGLTTLVATHRVEHAKKWQQYIISQGFSCGLMLGGTENAEEFGVTANSLRSRRIQCGVGTIQKVSTAHDIPALERGFVLGPLAGNIQLFNQMSGRLGRSYPGKEVAYLYYFWDRHCYPQHNKLLKKRYEVQVYNPSTQDFQ